MANRMKVVSNEELTNAVNNNHSIHKVIESLSGIDNGASREQFRRRIKELNLDTSHFTGQAHLKGKSHDWSRSIPLDEVLVENSRYNRVKLKERLIKNGALKNECSVCGISNQWNGLPLVLHIDHINGTHNDNRIENLRLLCPNCHSQTDTYCGKNKKEGAVSPRCSTGCGKLTKSISGRCFKCQAKYVNDTKFTLSLELTSDPIKVSKHIKKFKVTHPSKEQLSKMLWEMPTTKLSDLLGVSDRAIGKWSEGYGITKPPRGYWAKMAALKTEQEKLKLKTDTMQFIL